MDYESAMNNILEHIDAIENVEESINYFKEQYARKAAENDNQDWKTKYDDLQNRYNKLDGQYRERFRANDINTVNREDIAASRREADYAMEEKEKQAATNIKLEDLLD